MPKDATSTPPAPFFNRQSAMAASAEGAGHSEPTSRRNLRASSSMEILLNST